MFVYNPFQDGTSNQRENEDTKKTIEIVDIDAHIQKRLRCSRREKMPGSYKFLTCRNISISLKIRHENDDNCHENLDCKIRNFNKKIVSTVFHMKILRSACSCWDLQATSYELQARYDVQSERFHLDIIYLLV